MLPLQLCNTWLWTCNRLYICNSSTPCLPVRCESPPVIMEEFWPTRLYQVASVHWGFFSRSAVDLLLYLVSLCLCITHIRRSFIRQTNSFTWEGSLLLIWRVGGLIPGWSSLHDRASLVNRLVCTWTDGLPVMLVWGVCVMCVFHHMCCCVAPVGCCGAFRGHAAMLFMNVNVESGSSSRSHTHSLCWQTC